MGTNPIRVVMVDDYQILLDALSLQLNADSGIELVATATNGDDGLRIILDMKPDIAILDVDLPGRGSFDVANELVTRQKQTKLLFLTGYLSDVFIEHALRLRAHGFLLKGEPCHFLFDAVKRIANGEVVFSKVIEERLRYNAEKNRYELRSENLLSALTGRQLEVLRHLATGQSVKEVAREMHLSEKSIDSHKYRIMHKLGIHDRVKLARFAIREGLTQP